MQLEEAVGACELDLAPELFEGWIKKSDKVKEEQDMSRQTFALFLETEDLCRNHWWQVPEKKCVRQW